MNDSRKEESVDRMKYPSPQRHAALHEGLFFGAVFGLLLVLNGALDLLAGVTAGVLIMSVAGIGVYLYAAFRATFATGRLSTGLLAGFWTGLISSAINLVVLATLCMLSADALRQRALAATSAREAATRFTNASIVDYDIGLLALGVLMSIACGLVCGTLGGMIAIRRGRARQAPSSANEV